VAMLRLTIRAASRVTNLLAVDSWTRSVSLCKLLRAAVSVVARIHRRAFAPHQATRTHCHSRMPTHTGPECPQVTNALALRLRAYGLWTATESSLAAQSAKFVTQRLQVMTQHLQVVTQNVQTLTQRCWYRALCLPCRGEAAVTGRVSNLRGERTV
jgi:hypothetical protein